jgi:phosphatidylethanolamine-binding protein (PEBP) family uncharacterized protein
MRRAWWVLTISIVACVGCPAEDGNRGEKAMTIKVTSAAFAEGEMIPKKYTCDGPDVSPPLAWTGIPEGTKSIALI